MVGPIVFVGVIEDVVYPHPAYLRPNQKHSSRAALRTPQMHTWHSTLMKCEEYFLSFGSNKLSEIFSNHAPRAYCRQFLNAHCSIIRLPIPAF